MLVEQQLAEAEPLVERLEQHAVARLALAQRRLGAHALGDVAREHRDAAVLRRVDVDLEVEVASVAGEMVGEVRVLPVALHAAELPFQLGARAAGKRLPAGTSDEHLAPPPERALGRRVDRVDAELAVHGDVRVADPLEQARGAKCRLLGEIGVALTLAQRLGFLLLIEPDEGGDLLPEDVGIERLEEVVHRAGLVAGVHLTAVAIERGDEDDRREAGALHRLDAPRHLVSTDLGHRHVEEDDGELCS